MTNEKAIKEIQRWLDGCPFEDTKEAFDLAIKALNCQESLEKKIEFLMNERPQGKWNDKKVAFYLECSNCGALVSGYQPNIFLENEKLNYCPNCGADMRQEESE